MMECIHEAMANAIAPSFIEPIFYIDSDDEKSQRMAEHIQQVWPQTKYVIGERIVLSDMWNKCVEVSESDIFMQCGDDIRIRTNRWDEIVRNHFDSVQDKITFAFGYDGIHPKGRFGTHGFLHRRWIDVIGYFLPPYFEADYCDTWINEVATMIGRFHHIPVFTEHMHFTIGKHPLDKTHEERLQRAKDNDVARKYENMRPQRIEDANKLWTYLDSKL